MVTGRSGKNNALRRIFSCAGCVFIFIIGFAALYFGAAWACSRIAVPAETTDEPQDIAIYIKTNGAHTDIVVPVRTEVIDWGRELPYRNTVSKDSVYSYVGIGWGDRGFFLDMPTWDDLTPRLAVRAAFWLSSTAMHATYYVRMEENDACRRIMISRSQFERLVEYICGRFVRDAAGRFVNIPTNANYGLSDAFYEARGRYNLFYSCNTWANRALAAAGQRHCLWTIFDTGIFLKYE